MIRLCVASKNNTLLRRWQQGLARPPFLKDWQRIVDGEVPDILSEGGSSISDSGRAACGPKYRGDCRRSAFKALLKAPAQTFRIASV